MTKIEELNCSFEIFFLCCLLEILMAHIKYCIDFLIYVQNVLISGSRISIQLEIFVKVAYTYASRCYAINKITLSCLQSIKKNYKTPKLIYTAALKKSYVNFFFPHPFVLL